MPADLYDHPELYDALFPVTAHLPFYAALARQQAGAVLELACGTGLLTVPMAEAAGPVVGLDRSLPMLRAAKRRASAAGASVSFVQGDMRSFALGRQFDLVFVARNSLLHLLMAGDLLAALSAACRHLAPDGLLAFDVFNPDVKLLAREPGRRVPVMEVSTDAFGPVSVEGTPDYDSAAQVNREVWHISAPARQSSWVLPIAMRSIFPQELPLLLAAAGLALVSRSGDLAGTPFGRHSRSQVCLCRRAA